MAEKIHPKTVDATVEECLAALREIGYESVQIFAQYVDGEEDCTHYCEEGFGNIYACVGQIDSWLLAQRKIMAESRIGAVDKGEG